MRLTTALICGGLDLQNGFAYVLQGGAARFGKPAFPAAVQFHLLLQILAESEEDLAINELHVEVAVRSEHIKMSRASVTGTLALGHEPNASLFEGEWPTILLPLPIGFVAPAPGLYELEIRAGPGISQRLPFAVHASNEPGQHSFEE